MENRRVSEKKLSQYYCTHKKHIYSSLVLNPCLCVEEHYRKFYVSITWNRITLIVWRLLVAMQQNCLPPVVQCRRSREIQQQRILQNGLRLHSLCNSAAVIGFRFDLYTISYIISYL